MEPHLLDGALVPSARVAIDGDDGALAPTRPTLTPAPHLRRAGAALLRLSGSHERP
jgi:hypothetical protein